MIRAIVLFAFILASAGPEIARPTVVCGHSHNDYYRKRPLLDALDAGMISIEADIFLIDGRLLVGHDRRELRPERDFESMYLAPLAMRAREVGGVYGDGSRVWLLVDIKENGLAAYQALHELLAGYTDVLTVTRDGVQTAGPIQVVISGDRPVKFMEEQPLRFADIDGRFNDADLQRPGELVPLVSGNWIDLVGWGGFGEISESSRQRLDSLCERAKSAGKRLRFWALPNDEAVWDVALDAGVDLISVDDPARFARFMAKQRE